MAYALQANAAAIGLKAHSGWAALVTVSGCLDNLTIVERRRLELCDPSIAGSKQPFHAAEFLPLVDAQRWIASCAASSRSLAAAGLRQSIDVARRRNLRVAAFGLAMASGLPLPDLRTVLRSHALIHTAEGEMYRDALVYAAGQCGFSVRGVKEKEIIPQTSQSFGVSTSIVERRIAETGKRIGPPWTQDQKSAAMVGLLALRSTF